MEQEQQKSTPEEQENLQSKSVLQCKYCACDTNEDVIKAAFWTNIGLILIENIPAQLCEECGEQFFEEEITQRIQKVIKNPVAKAKRQIRVPAYSLSKVQTTKKELRPKVSDQQQTTSLESTYHQAKQTTETIRANRGRDETFLCKYCESETVEDLVKSVFWVDGGLLAVPYWAKVGLYQERQFRICQSLFTL
jgi:YgiT-type zinc finger domain-containing protein